MDRTLESLQDMVNAANQALLYASEINLDVLFENKLYQNGIIKELEILSEAGKRIPREWRDSHPDIEWQKIFNYRNSLVHNYDVWDLEEVWRIVNIDLLHIIPILERLIAKEATKRGLENI